MSKEVVLAFSGGLDTSFCVPWLTEQGYEVVTLFVDTGGVGDEERQYIEERAYALGAKEHLVAEVGQEIWDEVVVPLVRGGQLYQNQYPLLCSDRYLIVRKSLEVCDARGTKLFAHGCTGMGNDQVRFDLTVRALGDYRDPGAHPRDPARARQRACLRDGVPRGAWLRRAPKDHGVHHQREPAGRDHLGLRGRRVGDPRRGDLQADGASVPVAARGDERRGDLRGGRARGARRRAHEPARTCSPRSTSASAPTAWAASRIPATPPSG